MAAHVDPLVVGRVIGDVVDMFVPTMPLSVRFGTKDLTNGCEIKPSLAAAAPMVQIAGRLGDLFTLVMTDPDAPSPSEPTMKEWLHWLVVNIPGGSDPSQGQEVVPYMAPQPPLGIHRYVLVLYQQKARVAAPAQGPGPDAEMRARFSTRAFAGRHDLGLPVAAMYFNAQREPASRRRR
ncbi:protein MOTHER of FT and TFL1 homolog 1 [Lolium perenne]|uniref:FT05 n=1 Tax=Lolium perenne TaxID=4522 RepID=A0A3S6CQ22_LOLPR|nr:protein MOTHER of FT and TFL1 homolog 1 [Lolium perenne]AMB21805.1 FT05 [Lolium perenne]